MKLAKHHYLYMALIVALVIISIMVTYIVMDAKIDAKPVPTITPTQGPTVTPITVTLTVEPSKPPTKAPAKKPTNSAIQTRINEIDAQLTTLQSKKTKLQDYLKSIDQPIDSSNRPEGYNPMLDYEMKINRLENIRYDIQQVENQINTLYAERTQLLINQ